MLVLFIYSVSIKNSHTCSAQHSCTTVKLYAHTVYKLENLTWMHDVLCLERYNPAHETANRRTCIMRSASCDHAIIPGYDHVIHNGLFKIGYCY